MEYTENKVFLPFVIVTTFVFLIILSAINSGNSVQWEHTRIIVISAIIWAIWFALFIMEKIRGAKTAEGKGQFVLKLFIAVIVSSYFANTIWFSGYLTLNPINAILNGKIHQDTVFHAAIAESIKNYGYPGILLNDAGFLHYHFGSHIIMAILSIIFNVSVFSAYNFLYPVIFIPIYSYLIISVIIEIRKYKKENARLSVIDYVFLSFFFIGFAPAFILEKIGIWKSTWIISESFLLALIFFLLYIFLLLKILANHRGNLLSCFLTVIFIFICSSMKISIGFLLATGAIYLNFRKNMGKIRYWIVNILFLAIFILSYKIFSEKAIGPAMGNSKIQFLSFVRHYANGYNGMIPHYFLLMFFTLFVLYYQLSVNIPLKHALISKRLIIEETLFVVSIASLLPGLLLKIGGGSAVYFSYFQELIAICMLLGYNIPGKGQQKIQTKNVIVRNGVKFCMIPVILMVLINSKPMYSVIKLMKTPKNTTVSRLLTNVQDIINISKNEKGKYCIFLDNSAEIYDIYNQNARSAAIFIYPALTGIRTFTETYIDEKTDSASKSVFDEVKEKAKKMHLKYILHLYDDKYEVIEM